jgi:LysM repeat protein/ABC-type branched-subunit amino acid transport system substrate-binding protein
MKIKNHKSAVVCRRILLFVFIYHSVLLFNFVLAQSSPIKKFNNIETIDGKKYHIHTVKKGQTLYSISKTYETTVGIILANNPDAIDGLKTDNKLKIPFSGNINAVKNKIKKQTISQTKPEKDSKAKASLVDTTRKHSVEGSKKNTITLGPKKDSAFSLFQYNKPIGDIHVALFLPLDLASVEILDVGKIIRGEEIISDEVKTGIEFYEGAKLAFDSLRKQGFKGFLHIYDYSIDSISFIRLMKKAELKEMDLIIGPLYGKRFETVLKFAKENNINIVSPTLSGNNMLLGNPNTSKITPSYVTQMEELAKYIAEKFAGQNILLYNSASPKDKPYLNTFKRISNPILNKSNADSTKEITLITMKDFISKTKSNIVVIASTNQSFITEAVNSLYLDKQENKDSIIVVGLSNFMNIESLDFRYLKTLNAIISTYSFVDYTNVGTKKFILKFRESFKTEPTPYVFSGFDATYFYLSGLQKFGNQFQRKLPELKQKGIQTEFNFQQPDPSSGYENRGIGILKFENYSYKRIK